ncbi:hypothetical protein WH5701_10889 [Synechococcus sp. WH 5701]|nr:hypothetical protein WH5701_10889 [Synechococcus sp. WH 5701]
MANHFKTMLLVKPHVLFFVGFQIKYGGALIHAITGAFQQRRPNALSLSRWLYRNRAKMPVRFSWIVLGPLSGPLTNAQY